MLKRILLVGLAVALMVPMGLAAVWLWGQLATPAAAQTPEAQPQPVYNPPRSITVIGYGTVNITPDIARVSIGVETTAPTVTEAVDKNDEQMTAVMAALKAAGIADKDIMTSNYSITLERYPEMPVAEDNQAQPLTYRVSNMVTVTIRDLEAVVTVLDAVVEAGANNIWGVTFTVDDMEAAAENARGDAVADARERATILAELNGVELGPVLSVSEVVGGGNVPLAYDMAQKAMGGGGSPISVGELEIAYQVQVTYGIAP